MFGLFSPRCPIGPRDRVMVERGIGRLVDVIGLEWIRRTPVLTLEDLGDLLSNEPIAAAEVALRLESQFPFPVSDIEWVEEPDMSGQVKAQYVLGPAPMGVVPHQVDQTPELRTAHVVRCLCQHALATTKDFGPAEQQASLVTDLLAVLTGTGLFPANTTIQEKYTLTSGVDSWLHQRQPFMPSRLFGYAFAVRCWLIDQTYAEWAPHLRLDAREPFEQGLKFLKKKRPVIWDESRDTLWSFRSAPSPADVQHGLRHREPAVQINALYDVIDARLTDAATLDELAGMARDSSDHVREELVRTIAILNVDAREMGEALIMLADDQVPKVRALAAMALGEVSHPPTDAVTTLVELTRDSEPIVNAAAAESLLRFPDGVQDELGRIFQVLRQQLARCDYNRVDRFMHRLIDAVDNPELLIDQEFNGSDDDSWRLLLTESLTGIRAAAEEAAPA